MDPTLVLHVGRRMVETALVLAGPALAVATAVIGTITRKIAPWLGALFEKIDSHDQRDKVDDADRNQELRANRPVVPDRI